MAKAFEENYFSGYYESVKQLDMIKENNFHNKLNFNVSLTPISVQSSHPKTISFSNSNMHAQNQKACSKQSFQRKHS